MMRDYDRLTSLFVPDGALRMPYIKLDGNSELNFAVYHDR
jgi:hypothetical protein